MRYIFFVLLGLFVISGCGKRQDLIPNVPVNFSLPLTDPRLSRLSSPGGAVIISGYGLAGLVIYRRPTDGQYVAYDRASSVNPQERCAVTLDDSGFTVTDPCSGAKFSLIDGTPVKAPATRSLKEYSVVVFGGVTLRITN